MRAFAMRQKSHPRAVLQNGSPGNTPPSGLEPEVLPLAPDGGFPEPLHPVLFYHAVLPERTVDLADAFERVFGTHGWPPQWRDDMLNVDHFHATAHEVLGVVQGHAVIRLGGPHGPVIEIYPRDALVLPAGSGHCKIGGTEDFLMVGAYPAGQQWDMRRGEPSELEQVIQCIAAVPLPPHDPLGGELQRWWCRAT
jgi:uncharacterized protein YjlB